MFWVIVVVVGNDEISNWVVIQKMTFQFHAGDVGEFAIKKRHTANGVDRFLWN